MKREIQVGKTDYSVFVFIPDPGSTDGSGKTGLVAANLTVSGARMETDNDVTITDYTSSLNNLAALTSAHNDWGVLEVSSTLAPGLYRLDIADAIFASGAWTAVVYVMITSSAAAASPMEFVLVAHDPDDLGTKQSGDSFARLGAPVGASISADVAGVQSDTNDIQTRLPATLVSGRMDSSVGAMASGVLTDTAIAADAITDAKVASDVTIASVTGTVGSVTGAVGSVTGNIGGNVTGSVGSIATGGIAAASFAAGAIDAAAIATDAFGALELAAGAASEIATAVRTELATELGRIDAAVTTRASQASLDIVDDFLDTEVAAIKAKTDQLTFGTANRVDAQVFGMQAGVVTAAAIATDAIDADAIAADAVTEIQSGLATAANLATVAGYIDTEVAAIKAKTDNLPASPAATGDIPTAAAVADAVWDEAIAGHAGVGSTGEALAAAGSAGDPWATALPGAYGDGSAGKIVGDNINATISSRAAASVLGTAVGASISADIAAVQADTDDIQNRLPSALVSGRMDSSVGAMASDVVTASSIAADAIGSSELAASAASEIATAVRTELATELARVDVATSTRLASGSYTAPDNASITAIKANTDNLPTDPADQSLIIAATNSILAILGTPAGASIAADIALKTGYRLSSTGVADIVRTAMTESYAADGATPTLEQLLYMVWSMLNTKAIVGTTLTTKKLDKTTTAMTFTLDSGSAPTSQARAT